MSNDSIPTLEQSCVLAELVRRGELTDEYRYLIARLLDGIGTSPRTSAQTLERYPDTPEYVAAVWTPVGTAYARLLGAVLPGGR